MMGVKGLISTIIAVGVGTKLIKATSELGKKSKEGKSKHLNSSTYYKL